MIIRTTASIGTSAKRRLLRREFIGAAVESHFPSSQYSQSTDELLSSSLQSMASLVAQSLSSIGAPSAMFSQKRLFSTTSCKRSAGKNHIPSTVGEEWDDALFSGDSANLLRSAQRKERREKRDRLPQSTDIVTDGARNSPIEATGTTNGTRRSVPQLRAASVAKERSSSSSPSQLIYNVFTNRQTRSDSVAVRSVEPLGFAPNLTSRTMTLSNPDRLYQYACQLQRKEVSPARSWTGTLHRQLTSILMNADLESGGVEAATERLTQQVLQVLDFLHAVARSRLSHGAVSGVVVSSSSSTTAQPAHGSAPSEPFSESSSLVLSRDLLTDEQIRVLDLACEGHHLYIGGGAGSGKTTMLRVLKQILQKELHLAVACTAITGIAAVNIQGTTIHHRFGITREYQFMKKKELTKYDVIIIDEASMIPQQLFLALDEALRKANGVALPFGGVQLILCGDFMQLSAISDLPIIGMPLFRQNFVMVKLHAMIRQSAMSLFARQLSEMRRGVAPHDLSDTVNFLPSGSFVEDAINLLPTNAEVLAANEKQLAKLDGDEFILPPLLLPPMLKGQWSECYLITVPTDVSTYSDIALLSAIEQHLFRAPNIASLMTLSNTLVNSLAMSSPWGTSSMDDGRHGSSSSGKLPLTPSFRAISMYPVFDDAYALRIQFPPSIDAHEVEILKGQLSTLAVALKHVNGGVHAVKEVLPSADGLHTEKNEATLAHYARTSPVGAPLRLKLGCRVLVRSNLSSTIVNGSVGTVVGFRPCTVESVSQYLLHSQRDIYVGLYANFMHFEQSHTSPLLPVVDFGGGVVETIPPCSFDVGGLADTNHYSASIIAIPLTLAYAFTVHKVQGLTLVGRVHLELSKMWPCDHLLYVAMSRVKNPDQLSVSGYSDQLVKAATECLIFDESLPRADDATIPAVSMPATWKLYPGKRRAAIAEKAARRRARQQEDKRRELDVKVHA